MDFRNWYNYFKLNEKHLDHIEYHDGYLLTNAERKILTKPLQHFQKGENSEGKQLFQYASEFSESEYAATVTLFIKEEQRHSLALSKFMETQLIPKIKDHWVDSVFRGLRHLAGLELSIRVLLTAEVCAAIFYKPLRDASNSPALTAICEQILADEKLHINFQSFTLSVFNEGRGSFTMFAINSFMRTLLFGTATLVWLMYRPLMLKGRMGYFQFMKQVFTENARAEAMQQDVSLVTVPG